MSNYVCYGDQVYVELSLLQIHTATQSHLLCSNAFLDDSVSAVKSSDYKLADFRSCIFNVLPPLVNDQDDLGFVESLKKELSLLTESTSEDSETKGQNYLKDQLESRREQLVGMRENIRVLNAKLAKEKAQKEVHYGEIIVLQHMESGWYLSVEISRNVRARNLNGVRLQKDVTPGCYFRIHSSAIEHQRGSVEYTREIKLISVQLGTVLVIAKPEVEGESEKGEDEEGFTSPEIMSLQRLGRKKSYFMQEGTEIEDKGSENDEIDYEARSINGKKGIESFEDAEVYEVGTSVEAQEFSRIRLLEYCNRKTQEELEQQQAIKNGDFIRLELDDMYLTASKTPKRQFVTLYGAHREEWRTHNLVDSVFQVISYKRNELYPKGKGIKTIPKSKISEKQKNFILLKHLMTGQFLSLPEEGLVEVQCTEMTIASPEKEYEEGARESKVEKFDNIPKFKMINSDIKPEKNQLNKGGLISLVGFANGGGDGKWYMTKGKDEVNKLELDERLEHFVGKAVTKDTLQGVIHIKTNDLVSSPDTGRLFRVIPVEEVEVRRLMEFDWYAKVLSEFEENMQDIILGEDDEATEKAVMEGIKNSLPVFERLLTALKQSEGDIQEVLSGFEGDVQTLIREFKILDSICRLLWWFFVKQRLHNVLWEKERTGSIEFAELVRMLEIMILVVLESTKDNIVTHIYLSQYLKVFLMALLSPCSLIEKLTKRHRENLKYNLTMLLSRLISEPTLQTSPVVSQLHTYQNHIFMHIDTHSDYSTYILQLLTCFFKARVSGVHDSMLKAFTTRYLSNQSDTQILFPQLNQLSANSQDFQIQLAKKDLTETFVLSTAPKEVHEYLYWAFALLNALLDTGSLRLKYAILRYYDIWLCSDLLTSNKVSARIKSQVIGVVRKAHLGYTKLPFEKIPKKLRFNVREEFLRSYLEAFEAGVKETQDHLLSEVEKEQLEGSSLQEEGTWRSNLEGLRKKILESELEGIMHGRLEEVAFALEVMKGILDAATDVTPEQVLKMYHCIAEIVEKAAEEMEAGVFASTQGKVYYQVLIENYGQIFSVLNKIDRHTVSFAVEGTLEELQRIVNLQILPGQVEPSAKDQSKELEQKVESAFRKECEDWKSKEMLYKAGSSDLEVFTEKYTEPVLRKALWKVLEVEPSGSAGAIINLLRKKVGFEADVAEEIGQYAFITQEKELIAIVELGMHLLKLHQTTRGLQAQVEFGEEEESAKKAEDKMVLGEVVRNLENIILIVYDYEAHINEEQGRDQHKGAKRAFLERLQKSKKQSGKEVPFEFKERHIKKDFQKALRMFNTHKVVLALLEYLVGKPELLGATEEDSKQAAALVGVILRLFVEDNVPNKLVLGEYPKFLPIFFDKAKARSTLEFLGVFSEICFENKMLVNMQEIPLFRVTLEYFLEFLNNFTLTNNSEFADSYLPVTLISNSRFLFITHLPKDLFKGVRMMNNIIADMGEFLAGNRRLGLKKLLDDEKSKQQQRQGQGQALTPSSPSSKTIIELPPIYSFLKEFWRLEAWLAKSENKENILVLQSRFVGTTLHTLLSSANMMFHMELKKVMLEAFETLHYKTQVPNHEVFESEETLDDVLECLMVDVYWFLKNLITEEDDEHGYLIEIFENGLLVRLDPKLMERYREIMEGKPYNLSGSTENLEFYEFQSMKNFKHLWKDYIYYVLCGFIYNLVDNYRRYFTSVKYKVGEIKTFFELWTKVLLSLSKIEKDREHVLQINEVLRKAMVMSEYSIYKDYVMQNVESEEQEKKKVLEDQERKLREIKFREEKKTREALKMREAVEALEVYFKSDSLYKWKAKLQNTLDMSKAMEKRKGLIERLVQLLKKRSTHGKDIRFIIRVLRRVVELDIIAIEGDKQKESMNKPIYLWKPLSSENYQSIRGIQNIMNEKNVVEAIFDLLYRHSGNLKLTREALTLGITLLYGGNKAVQDSFYTFFKADYENTILENLTDILEDTTDELLSREERRLKRNYYKTLKFLFKYYRSDQNAAKEIRVRDDLKQEIVRRFNRELEPRDRANAVGNKHYRFVLVILTFLRMLCQGHNYQFQEFLRDQRVCGHSKSFNVLSYMKEVYQDYYRNVSRYNIEFGIKTLELMTDMQQGNSKANNDILLTESMVYTLFNTLYASNVRSDLDLLARGFELDPHEFYYLDLKQQASVLLLGIFEKGEPEIHHSMSQYIDFKLCVRTIYENMRSFCLEKVGALKQRSQRLEGRVPLIGMKELKVEDLWSPYLNMAMNMYMILKYISLDEHHDEFTKEIRAAFEEVSKQDSRDPLRTNFCMYMMKFLKEYTTSIEVYNGKTGQVLRVFFPISVDFYYMTDETINNFAQNVDRSNTQTKVSDLLRRSEHLMSHMEMEYFSRDRPFGLNYNKLYDTLRDITHILAFIIAVVILISLERVNGETKFDPLGYHIQFGLILIQIVVSFFILALWVMTRMTKHLTSAWERHIETAIQRQGSVFAPIHPGITEGTIQTIKDDKGKSTVVLKLRGPNKEQSMKILSKQFIGVNILFALRNKLFLWHIGYFVICVTSFLHPGIAALQLLDIALHSDTFSRIGRVIWQNAQQFIWTLTMLLITVYIYTMLAFFFLQDRFKSEDFGNFCDDTYECYIAILNLGLRSGGGIAEQIQPVRYDPGDKLTYLFYALFDLSFYIIIILMLLNFIFGMIIDAFVELRNLKNKIQEDKQNVCFICGIQRSEYERYASFDLHIQEEHNYLHYIAYLLYLRHKSNSEPTELTDIESYVWKRYLHKDPIWIPVGRSITLERQKEKEEKMNEFNSMKVQMEGNIEEYKKHLENEVDSLKDQMKINFDKIFTKLK